MPYSHPDDSNKYQRERYANDPEFRRKALARSKRRDPKKSYEAQRRWRQLPENREKVNARLAKYRVNHRAYFSAKSGEYRARVRQTKTEPVDYVVVVERSGGLCGICHESLGAPIEIDHIIPISRGGSHTYDNLQATHASCNKHKWARLPNELGRR